MKAAVLDAEAPNVHSKEELYDLFVVIRDVLDIVGNDNSFDVLIGCSLVYS